MQMWEVFFSSNFCYGPNNPTLWPQPYLTQYPHLAAIPKGPGDHNHPLSIMWWNPTRDEFQPLENDFMEGVGQLSLLNLWRLEEKLKEIEDKIMEYCKTTPSPNPLLLLLAKSMTWLFSSSFLEKHFWSDEVHCYQIPTLLPENLCITRLPSDI